MTLFYREAIGRAHYVYGGFETAELELLCSRIPQGALVLDVGANVGYFTVPLALAVGPSGRVLAFEPEPENARRLHENAALNGLTNVEVRQVAVGAHDGETTLFLTDDSVFHTTAAEDEQLPITTAHGTGARTKVAIARLDTVWRSIGSPEVAFVKIDVEGTELSVLEGGSALLGDCRPDLLIESAEPRFEQVRELLADLGYVHTQPARFSESNHLFTPSAKSARGGS